MTCIQSLGRVTSSPVLDAKSNEVVLTYENGAKCQNGLRWRSVLTFMCDESQLQVCSCKHCYVSCRN